MMIDSVAINGIWMIIPSQLQWQILNQPHSTHMGIENMRLLACKSIYWINMSADRENAVKQCSTCLEYENMQPQEKTTPHELPTKPWEVVGAYIL